MEEKYEENEAQNTKKRKLVNEPKDTKMEEDEAKSTKKGSMGVMLKGLSEGRKKLTKSQEEIQKDTLTRTNSIHIESGKEVKPITYSTRNIIGNSYNNLKVKKDGLKIAVFSQEASRNFSTEYQKQVHTKEYYQFHQGKNAISEADISKGNSKEEDKSEDNSKKEDISEDSQKKEAIGEDSQKKEDISSREQLQSKVKNNPNVNQHDEALIKLFENKEKPHVVAVLEGDRKTLKEKFTLKEGNHSYTYTLHKFWIKGEGTTATQNMHFYVRDDMAKAITLDKQVIKAKSPNPSFKHGKSGAKFKYDDGFTVGEVQCETENGKKYSVLVTHIPNRFTGSLDSNTHDALQKHKVEGRTVVGYMGDTNYKSMMQKFSSPSVGGNVKGEIFLSPKSSSDKKHSYFMQVISRGTNTDQDPFLVVQASTLNHVGLQLGEDPTATDHPSFQTTIILDSEIKGRDYDYFEEETKAEILQMKEALKGEVPKTKEIDDKMETDIVANVNEGLVKPVNNSL